MQIRRYDDTINKNDDASMKESATMQQSNC